jgi:probable rRNA maturation factor
LAFVSRPASAADHGAEAARRSTRLKGGFTVLLAGDKKLRALNHDFRGKDKPTNVLSFPGADSYAGDIAIAYGVTRKMPRLPPRRSPTMPPIWWCMVFCIWRATITNAQRMPR